jgi:hypothetical protein
MASLQAVQMVGEPAEGRDFRVVSGGEILNPHVFAIPDDAGAKGSAIAAGPRD